MSRTLVVTAALLIVVWSVQITSAQLPVKIPKVAKPSQPKPEPSSAPATPASTEATQPTTRQTMNESDGQPRIDKSSILLTTQKDAMLADTKCEVGCRRFSIVAPGR